MGFTLFFFAAWLVIAIFTVMDKKLSIRDNTFVFLIILVISINWSWIIAEELKFIKITEVAIDYTAFVLFRSITIPMILVIQLNLFHRSSTFTKSAITVISSITLLLLLNVLSIQFNISNYKEWNLGYDAIYFIFLHLIAFYSQRLLQKLASGEVNYS